MRNPYNPEDAEDNLATQADACREYVRNVGCDRPDSPWIHSPWDTWSRNPAYQGPAELHPHPEEN